MTDDEFRDSIKEILSTRTSIEVPRVESTPTSSVIGSAAGKEANAIAAGDLEAASAQNEHRRTETFRSNVAIAVIIVFWISFAVVVFSASLWVVNFLKPEWKLLSDDQSSKIFSFLTGSGLTGFIGNYAKKRLT